MAKQIPSTSPGGKHDETATRTDTEDVAEEELLTFEETVALLLGVPGYNSRETVRRALVEGRIPSTRVTGRGGPAYRIARSAIDALIADTPRALTTAPSTDKLLFEHFAESPHHNPVTAVFKNITKSAGYATKMFKIYQRWESGLRAVREEEARLAWEAEVRARSATEPPCPTCGRPYTTARWESGTIGREVTGRVDTVFGASLWVEEEEVLANFKERWRCRKCCQWIAGAPVAAMRNLLHPRASNGLLEQILAQLRGSAPPRTPGESAVAPHNEKPKPDRE
jgi:excisionase family DNA binding protein